jgi:bacterioferritin
VNDRVTKNLFEELMADEEGHIDFLETQLELIRQVGVQLYAQKHIGGLDNPSEAS